MSDFPDERPGIEALREEIAQLRAQQASDYPMAALGRLSAAVLHEVNSPIAAIVANLDARERALDALGQEHLGGKGQRALEVLRALGEVDRLACERIQEAVRAWKTQTRSGGDAHGPVSLNGLLRDTIRLVNAMYRQRVHIESALAAAAAVWGVAAQLGQVFLNLLVNAAQAIPGKGEIRVETEDVGGGMVEVRIRDNGSGMTPEVQARVFAGGVTTKPAGVGTGLGLMLSRRIVEEGHRGTIRFESTPGRGTTFFVRLPAAGPSPEER